jgi:preprotein translocase subunit SecD
VPIEIIKQQNIAPTLGAASISSSIKAGSVGLGLVALFMIQLRWLDLPDLGSDHIWLTYSCCICCSITVTLPGLAGFILSIGMAVDSKS